ncbi:hypothetical protein TOPH_07347 [Tolypocladium ophioglossoides CBS 100239]|uniref:Uncharacterized protein n=1 Tax=Tolypocladium ophioglossoides (strain CBS 100239) TaxID=1163406 RepID=A0A0L0N1S6_TOLOC|nr:hypothetical protein TOPH_07347 [Tolypocladium ophioglossoides CBS 100239]
MPATHFSEDPRQKLKDSNSGGGGNDYAPAGDSASRLGSAKDGASSPDGIPDDGARLEKVGTYEITEEDCYDELGFSFPE